MPDIPPWLIVVVISTVGGIIALAVVIAMIIGLRIVLSSLMARYHHHARSEAQARAASAHEQSKAIQAAADAAQAATRQAIRQAELDREKEAVLKRGQTEVDQLSKAHQEVLAALEKERAHNTELEVAMRIARTKATGETDQLKQVAHELEEARNDVQRLENENRDLRTRIKIKEQEHHDLRMQLERTASRTSLVAAADRPSDRAQR
jgi:chromosome segregation ATPase